MAELMFGVETEYAISGMGPHGAVDLGEILQSLMEAARGKLVHLPDMCSMGGVFLGNGSRFYVDCGGHPEIGTPECTNPWDAVRYIQAGHSVLAGVAAAVEGGGEPGMEVLCFRCNVDYSGSQATWGCHESYLHRKPIEELQSQIIPHLVTRLIYTGAGGFNPLSQGLEFTLSPRMAYVQRVVSGDSTGNRGIWHTRTEPLCSGYHRLHVLCGESLCSETATFLKIGVTALMVAMADAGLAPGKAVQLADPLAALQQVAGDVTCKRPVTMADGSSMTAIAIQRHYLEQAEGHVGDSFMSAWAAEVCRRWRAVLDQLEDAPGSVAQTLDWGIKFALYADHAAGAGVRWSDLPFWNEAIGQLATAFGARGGRTKETPLELAIAPKLRMPKEMAAIDPLLRSRGLRWEELRTLLGRRQKFFEIDMRFGQLGPKGIFQMLDVAGVLNHRVSGVDNIEQAAAEPPATGRAHLRGKVIQRLAAAGESQCDWQRIADFGGGQVLDLSNPFATQEVWLPLGDADVLHMHLSRRSVGFRRAERDGEEQSPYSRRQAAFDRYLNRDYSGAEALLRRLLAEQFELPSTHTHLARVLVATDRFAEARLEIERAWATHEVGPGYVLPRILFFQILFAILDEADFGSLIEQMKAALHAGDAHSGWTIQPMLHHLRSQLGATNSRFLKALADALSDERGMPSLEQLPQWHADEAAQLF
jgi:hypothetical protein